MPALLAWALVHATGVHATVAGVLLGLLVPVHRQAEDPADPHTLAETTRAPDPPLLRRVRRARLRLLRRRRHGRGGGFAAAFADPAALGVIVGLVVGKAVGIFGGTWALARFTRAELDEDLAWIDVFGLSLLAGVGFTVSLLVGELAFGTGSARDDHVKLAVLLGSASSPPCSPPSSFVGATATTGSSRRETADLDDDGIPDIYQAPG